MEEQKRNSGELRTWLLLAGIALILVAAGLIAFFISGGFGGVEEEVTFQVFFEKIGENIWWVLGSLAVMAAGIGILFYYNRKKDAELSRSAWTIREIAVAALCIALAFVLSYIRLWKMPNGGSVTAASMLPILLFSYIYGMRKGLLAAIAFGVLQFIQEPVFLNWVQFVLDYLLGFGVLAIAGAFRRSLYPGMGLACLARFFCSFLSGAIFFGEYAPAGQSAWVYSLGYNASYMLPEAIICIAIALIPAMRHNIESLKTQAMAKAVK